MDISKVSTAIADAVKEAGDLRIKFPDAFVGGSYITNRETANDIDIIVPAWHNPDEVLIANGFILMNEEYGTSKEVPELVSTWRKGSLNVLVVSDYYVCAYRAATTHMRDDPASYQTRESRIAIHQRYKKQITAMLTPQEKQEAF